jgi:putative membrane protein
MIARWLLAAVHLLALGIGLGAIWVRATALRTSLDPGQVQRVLRADSLWGLAAFLWIGSGLWRLLGGLEKPPNYYFHNVAFQVKMGLLALVLLLEIRPMLALISWRRQIAGGTQPATQSARRLATVSFVQAGLIVLMVVAATAMARGIGSR